MPAVVCPPHHRTHMLVIYLYYILHYMIQYTCWSSPDAGQIHTMPFQPQAQRNFSLRSASVLSTTAHDSIGLESRLYYIIIILCLAILLIIICLASVLSTTAHDSIGLAGTPIIIVLYYIILYYIILYYIIYVIFIISLVVLRIGLAGTPIKVYYTMF